MGLFVLFGIMGYVYFLFLVKADEDIRAESKKYRGKKKKWIC